MTCGLSLVSRLQSSLRDVSIRIFEKAGGVAEKRGILIADTKFEFGMIDGKLKVIDEMLTPDSSRFWSAKEYKPGKSQESYDKQIIRDYLNRPRLGQDVSRTGTSAGDCRKGKGALRRDTENTDRKGS